MLTGQIIVMGGGGFSEGSEPGLDEYLLKQARRDNPRIGFIGTASGDAESYLLKFYRRFAQLACTPSHLPFFRRTPNIAAWIDEQDVIFVGGGNTKSMLAVWSAWGLPVLLEQAARNGVVLSGISAGAICWFDCGITDSHADSLGPIDGLGFLAGSCCAHYTVESDRRPTFERLIGAGEIPAGFAIDDGAALHFIDGAAKRVVSGRAGVSAYAVRSCAHGANSTPIDAAELIDVSS